MRKIEKTRTPQDFERITRVELHRLWFKEALTDKQIATMYGVDKSIVKEKRKAFKLGWISSGILYVAGSDAYRKEK